MLKGIVGTHATNFHCDDVTSAVLLKFTNYFKNHKIIRSLNMDELAKCELVFDVGGVYDPSTNRYDHHQRTFNETFSALHTVKLSSCGLLFKHFGHEIVTNMIIMHDPYKNVPQDSISWLTLKLYNTFILPIDANDNGIDALPGKPLFVDGTGLSSRVANLNSKGYGAMKLDSFVKAQELVKEELLNCFRWIYFKVLPSVQPVKQVFSDRFKYDQEGRIMVMNCRGSWKECLSELEDEEKLRGIDKPVLYVIDFNNSRDQWGCIATPLFKGSFEMKKPFPPAWRGLRDDELTRVCGVPDSVFVHSSGFLACNKTFDGIFKMTQLAADSN
ncbi:Metal-dependent protein hydrolase [Entamoeba marina]